MSGRSHFVISYFGSKRTETKEILKGIDLSNIKYIVEPFCGTSALSYAISKMYPNKFEYILNDNNDKLIRLYEIMKDDHKIKMFNVHIQIIFINMNKNKYVNLPNDTHTYYIYNKYYYIRPGLYPLKSVKNYTFKGDIINFIRTEKVILNCKNGNDVYDKYKDKHNALIFLDPPYMFNTCMSDYGSKMSMNIYPYLYKNPMKNNNAIIILCLEKMWITELLFSDYKFIEYDKKYCNGKRKKTTHIVINNKLLNIHTP
jgi:site-specific DNA-adenine methylase